MTRPPAIGAVSSGIRYQVRFFWRHALRMLLPNPVVSKVVLEHNGVDAVDDVVVYYTPPGRNDRGSKVSVDFNQIKFHVAQSGIVDHQTLVDPNWTGTKKPILKRFADAWGPIVTEHPDARLFLVTNWPWNHQCPVAGLIRDGGWLDENFFVAGPKTKVHEIHDTWQAATGLADPDFTNFLRALRFSTSAASMDEAEFLFNVQCHSAGLVPVTHGADHSPYDDLGLRLIESGRTEHTPDTLRELLKNEGLVATPNPPFKSTFAVCSFPRFAFPTDAAGDCVVDLTDLFQGRIPMSPDVWSQAIRSRLEDVLPKVAELGKPVQVALDAHLSIDWYVGYLLDAKSGIPVVLRQHVKGKGIELWEISKPAKPKDTPNWVVEITKPHDGSDLAVVVSATHNAFTDAVRTINEDLPSVGTIIHSSLALSGPQSIADGAHAAWLANELSATLASKVAELRPNRIHLFLACPASLAFLLGQEAKCLGPTTVYEFEFGSVGRKYRPGMST